MATVLGKTSIKIDELVNGTIVNGYIAAGGQLILVTAGGAEIMAGSVTRSFEGQWSPAIDYITGDVVGYAGMVWKALTESTNKPPALFTSYWGQVTADSATDWSEKDPFFLGDSLLNSWDFSVRAGSPSAILTMAPGEFQSGQQALRLSLAASEAQDFFQKEENIVTGGEEIIVTIRARLSSTVPSASIDAILIQSDADSAPFPTSLGYDVDKAYVPSTEGPAELSTTWSNYTFSFEAVSAKPRAVMNFLASCESDSGATFFIDYIRVEKKQLASETDNKDFSLSKDFASSTNPWDYVHGRGTKDINVSTVDSFGQPLHGDVSYPDTDTVRVSFYHGQTGTMRIWN